MMDDTSLLQLLREDPNRGMKALIERYGGLVYHVIRGRLHGAPCLSSDIEDCAADVFSEFYLSLPRFDPSRAAIATYLCVIARHSATDLLRKRGRQSALFVSSEATTEELSDGIEIEVLLSEEETRREVIAAIRNLGNPDTELLFRRYYYGQSSKEIAKAVGMTVSGVNTRIHRALQKLKASLRGNNK